jgi:hypothetical protein
MLTSSDEELQSSADYSVTLLAAREYLCVEDGARNSLQTPSIWLSSRVGFDLGTLYSEEWEPCSQCALTLGIMNPTWVLF